MKTITLLCIVPLITIRLAAQVDGPLNSNLTSNSSLSGSVQSWVNDPEVSKSDDTYASFGNISGGVGNYTDYLRLENFGFNIPPGTTIKGIKIEIERSDPNSATSDFSIRIIREGVICGNEQSTGIAYPVTDAYKTYGGASDLWGETWSFKNINAVKFGVAIAAQRNNPAGNTAGQIDDVIITVYYDFVTLPLTLTSFKAVKENKKVNLSWSTVSEINMNYFEVERSSDGRLFYSLTSIPCLNQSTANYSFIDENPVAGTSYYRLKILEVSGDQKYSKIIPVSFSQYTAARLSPSPWARGTDLFISNPGEELLTIRFYDAGGQLIGRTTTLTHQIVMPVLATTKGIIYYKVADKNNQIKGSGSLLVY